jgi:hypothetical protein
MQARTEFRNSLFTRWARIVTPFGLSEKREMHKGSHYFTYFTSFKSFKSSEGADALRTAGLETGATLADATR